MKRSTWVAVLVTAAVLVVAGNLPRLPLDALVTSLRSGIGRQASSWPRLDRRIPAVVHVPHAAVSAPVSRLPRPARAAHIAVAPPRLLATLTPPWPVTRAFAPPSWIVPPVRVAAPMLAGALAGLLAVATLAMTLRRDRRAHVWRLARRGLTLARIARSARVPQDAVRTLLTPGLGARR